MSGARANDAPRAGTLAPILAIHFIGTLGFSIVLPFLVYLVTRWGGNALIYGLLGATYSAFQLIGAPLLGRWSDTFGRRRILLLSQLGTLLSWVLFGVAFWLPPRVVLEIDSPTVGAVTLTLPLTLLFVARALDGLTGGNVSVAQAYVADVTPEEERSTSFGKMSIASNLGFIVGPALAGVLGSTAWGELLPVLAALSISAVATGWIALGLPESRPCQPPSFTDGRRIGKTLGQEPRECYEPRGAGSPSLGELLSPARVKTLLAIHFLVMLGFNFFYVTFPVHAIHRLEWSVVETGLFFSVLSALMALVQGPVLRRAATRFSDPGLATFGSATLAVAFLVFVVATGPTAYLGAAVLSLGNGLMWPSVLSLLSRAAGERYQGGVQGLAGSGGAVASIVGLLVGGALYSTYAELVFVLAATTVGGAAVLTARLSGLTPNEDSTRG